jgi:hypothetical protein
MAPIRAARKSSLGAVIEKHIKKPEAESDGMQDKEEHDA